MVIIEIKENLNDISCLNLSVTGGCAVLGSLHRTKLAIGAAVPKAMAHT